MRKMLLSLATVAALLTGGLAMASPTQAVQGAAAVPPSVCPIATGAEWNARNPGKQKAADLGAIVPGVNAGAIGTDVACMPVPALDYESTAKLRVERGEAVEKASRLKKLPSPDNAAIKGKPPTMGKSFGTKRLVTCTGPCRFYAAAIESGLTGITSHTWTQRVAKPGLGSDGLPNGHTLAEGTIAGAAPGGGGNNYVELGTTVDAVVCGGTGVSPCLFVFNWTPTPGCYNGCGWINAGGCNPCMGSSLTSWVGTSKVFSLNYISGSWWASANNQYVAGIPASDWPSSNFTSGTQIDEFFEVAVGTSGGNGITTTPNTDMGDKFLASCSGTVQGSYFINGTRNGSAVNLGVYNSATGGGAVDVTKYNVCLMPGSTHYFRGGGPGY